jgi:polyadenylate-binding protein
VACTDDIVSRTQNDDSLRNKVDEAMTVYHEYIKNQGGPGMPGGEEAGIPSMNGGGGSENLNPTAEAVKDAEA